MPNAAKYIKIFTDLPRKKLMPDQRTGRSTASPSVAETFGERSDCYGSLFGRLWAAVEASNILFGNSTHEALLKLDEDTLLAVFEGVPHFDISRDELAAGIKAVDLCTEKAAIFPSKGEMRNWYKVVA